MNERDHNEGRLARIETTLGRLDAALLGVDGNGGFVNDTRSKLAQFDRERAWVKGAFAVISAVVSALGLGTIFHIVSGLDKTK